jgi:hypothetical protein
MTAEIRRYLEEHGDTYTVEALHAQRMGALHDARDPR